MRILIIYLILILCLDGDGCNKKSDSQTNFNRFIGKWISRNNQGHIIIKADTSVDAILPVIFSEKKIKSEPGMSYMEGNFEIMGNGTPYLLQHTIDSQIFWSDSNTVAIFPEYTSMTLFEKTNEGNIYLKRIIAKAVIHAKGRHVADSLEIYTSLRQKSKELNLANAAMEIILLKAVVKDSSICLSPVNLFGFQEECYYKGIGRKNK
jgi:hypothetical protein